jgi:hypothetical protein
MSRVNEPCQSTPVFVPEPLFCGDPPARRRQTASEGSPHQRSREHLEKLGGKHRADTGALEARRHEHRVRERNSALKEVLVKLLGHVLPEAAAKVFPVLTPAGAAASPVGSVWMLLSGLADLGRINHEVQVVSEQSAQIRGFAETLGKALDEPALSAPALQAAARGAKYPSHYSGLASARLPGVPARQLEDFRKLAAAYAEGAAEAVTLAKTLSTEDRRALGLALAEKVDSVATTSSDRLVGWFHLPR